MDLDFVSKPSDANVLVSTDIPTLVNLGLLIAGFGTLIQWRKMMPDKIFEDLHVEFYFQTIMLVILIILQATIFLSKWHKKYPLFSFINCCLWSFLLLLSSSLIANWIRKSRHTCIAYECVYLKASAVLSFLAAFSCIIQTLLHIRGRRADIKNEEFHEMSDSSFRIKVTKYIQKLGFM